MNATKKTNSIMTTKVVGHVLTIDVIGAGQIVFDATQASAANRAHAEMHGWTQRLADKAAKGRDPKTGASATPQQKYDAISELANYYLGGDVAWRMVGTRGASSELGLLIEALVEFSGKDRETTIKFLDGKTPLQRTALLNSQPLAEIVARLRAAATADVDTDSMLEGLLGDSETNE